jgi:hypothetical protein
LGRALTAQRLREEDIAWRALRADSAAIILTVLGEHLGSDQRRLPAAVLFERVDQELEELRPALGLGDATGKAYCEAWVRQGYLIRRPATETRDQTLELSDGALQALAFLRSREQRSRAVTESRLATILERIHDLAIQTDPDATSRLVALRARRDAIDHEIDLVERGEFTPLATARASERTRDILSLAEQLPSDFAQVRAEIEAINHGLRMRLIDDAGSRGDVLEEVFFEIDHLEGSEAGRSLVGFHDLINDPESSTVFDDDIDVLLEREFAESLSAAERRALRTMVPVMQSSSREVRDVMTSLSRSLRRFVHTQQHARSRKVHLALREALKAAAAAAPAVAPYTRLEVTLPLTSVPIRSVSSVNLHNPADSHSAEEITTQRPEVVDLREVAHLTRLSDIDYAELTAAVNDVVAHRGAATLSEVLDAHPATQGVASVIGLMVLGERHGRPLPGSREMVWRSPTGRERRGLVPDYLFERALPTRSPTRRATS